MSSRRQRRQHRRRARRITGIAVATAVVLAVAVSGAIVFSRSALRAADDGTLSTPSSGPADSAAAVTTTTVPRYAGWVDPKSAFLPYPDATVSGLLTFRGNPTRTWHGAGPLPVAPHAVWQYPKQKMCSLSKEFDEVSNWCGTGWTGQPAVFDRDGRSWVVFVA